MHLCDSLLGKRPLPCPSPTSTSKLPVTDKDWRCLSAIAVLSPRVLLQQFLGYCHWKLIRHCSQKLHKYCHHKLWGYCLHNFCPNFTGIAAIIPLALPPQIRGYCRCKILGYCHQKLHGYSNQKLHRYCHLKSLGNTTTSAVETPRELPPQLHGYSNQKLRR